MEDDDRKLTDEELAQVVEEEILEEEAQRPTYSKFRETANSLPQKAIQTAQDIRSRFDEFKAQREAREQEKEEADFEKARAKLEQAKKQAELNALREQARSYQDKANAPRRQRQAQLVGMAQKTIGAIGNMMSRPQGSAQSLPPAYAQRGYDVPPAFASSTSPKPMLVAGNAGGSWLSDRGSRNGPSLSWLSSGRKPTNSWLFSSKPKAVRRVKRVRVKRRKK